MTAADLSDRQRRILTRRQLEVLRLVANGNTNAEIARWLWISPDTVHTSLRLTYRALGVHDRAHAVAIALRLGLIRLEEIRMPEPKTTREGEAA